MRTVVLFCGAIAGAAGFHHPDSSSSVHPMPFYQIMADVAAAVDQIPRPVSLINTPSPPVLPKKYVATSVTIYNGSTGQFNATSQLVSDADLERIATVAFSPQPRAPVNATVKGIKQVDYSIGSCSTGRCFSGCDWNGQKLLGKGGQSFCPNRGFYDMFAWLPLAGYKGTTKMNGHEANMWEYNMTVPYTMTMTLYTDSSTDAPLRLVQNGTYAGYGHIYNDMIFTSWRPGAGSDELWKDFSEDDFKRPPRCPPPADMSPKNVSMYIFHPVDVFNITRQDLGDIRGDTFFTCNDLLSGAPPMIDHGYAWLSEWRVELVPWFGTYQNCNDYGEKNSCVGEEDWLVGREAAMALGSPMAGQCEQNPESGVWWSLPYGGQCTKGSRPGDGTCTWHAERVKTIDGHCLFNQQGFVDACKADNRAPFISAEAKFTAAFASDIASKGGCPALKV